MTRLLFTLLLLVYFFPASLKAQSDGARLVEASLIADHSGIAPGKPFTVGLKLKMAPKWHTFWANAGDSGLPTTIDWELPEGWKAGEIQWPLPIVYQLPGDLTIYGYEKETMLLVEITPAETLPPGEVTLKANAAWVVCDVQCVRGGEELQLTLPVSDSPQPVNEETFAAIRAQLPQTGAPPYELRWEPKDTEVYLKVNGLPEGARIEFFPLNFLTGPPAVTAPGAIRIPYPPAPEPPFVQGLLTVSDASGKERKGWYIEHKASGGAKAVAATGATTTAGGNGGFGNQALAEAAAMTLPRALTLGFLGGFILNLMPCVLPVIGLKILGFVGQAGESRARVFKIGLSFTAGVFAWFLLMATVVVVARAGGKELAWAFQFQNPTFVFWMLILVFVFSLNLLGVFEIWLPGTGKLVNLSGQEGYGGAFMHGAFATVLATPCVGPMMAPALTFAFTQPALITFAMFAAIAAGMSLPYVMLTAQPAWLAYLPKPGDWMVRLKQVMGLLLLGTAVWLLSVVDSQGEAKGEGIRVLWILLGTGAACWVFGAWVRPGMGWGKGIGALLGMGIAIAIGLFFARPPVVGWQPWSSEVVEKLRDEGRPVFVDFTADWCLTCKYNERMVLASGTVREKLNDFAMLKADWTNGDPAITKTLKEYGRSGVPVYLVYPKGGGEPELLPELLTPGLVEDALERALKR